MRACAQCGLSVGETAAFCPVCGATAESLMGSAPADADLRSAAVQAAQIPADDGSARQSTDAEAAPPSSVPRHHQEDVGPRLRWKATAPVPSAAEYEKSDPVRAVHLYRSAILTLLETTEDPLDREDVRRGLVCIFDRLSLVLKREGSPEEALEEADCAASLGLLDCEDRGVKKQREALRKRRESLRRSVEQTSSHLAPCT
jgi:hypothetical protein